MPRSRRAKSQSISSNISEPVLVNGSMPPPSPPSSSKPSPNLVRHRKSPSATHTTPTALSHVAPKTRDTIPSIPAHRPGVIRFVAIAVLSSFLEAFSQSLASEFSGGDLAAVSKHSESWIEVGGLLAWKITTLGIYWFGGFDAYDVASLTLLLRTPTIILLSLFYLISPLTLALTTVATVASTTLPFVLFRALIPQHDPKSHPHAPRSLLRNKSIITDPYTTISTSLLATAIFAVILEISFSTFLPVYLVTHYDGLRSLQSAHSGAAVLPYLLISLLPAGYAATTFLFTPSTGVTDLTVNEYVFDAQVAGLWEHVIWNSWGWYSPRQKELISRTALLTLLVVVETVIETSGEIKGVDVLGGVGYAGIWGVAIAATGAILDWVGGPSD